METSELLLTAEVTARCLKAGAKNYMHSSLTLFICFLRFCSICLCLLIKCIYATSMIALTIFHLEECV
jgi:hypothetical protein